jgi:hypothetical protein
MERGVWDMLGCLTVVEVTIVEGIRGRGSGVW